jgi:Icc-related predicted phosphoesterase
VVFVAGNHSYYGSTPAQVEKIRTSLNDVGNLHWLENSTVTLGGQRFVGSTLWFPDSFEARTRRKMLSDFAHIKQFEPWVWDKNLESAKFLTDTVGPDDVVVTHHMPSNRCIQEEYAQSSINCYFVTDLTALIVAQQPKLWCFGHTHLSSDFYLGNTRMVCNPFGYVGYDLNPAFRDDFTVDTASMGDPK